MHSNPKAVEPRGPITPLDDRLGLVVVGANKDAITTDGAARVPKVT